MPVLNLDSSEYYSRFSTTQFCVVGGGVAGLLLAHRIAKSGRRVIVLESGHTSFDAAIHRLNEIENPGGLYTRAMDGRYRALGGSSTRWGGRMISVSSHDRAAREHIDQPAWEIASSSIDHYEADLEQLFELAPAQQQTIPSAQIDRDGYLVSQEHDITTRWAKCPKFKLCNVATVVGPELRSMKNIDIWLGATVCDFDIDHVAGRLVGVKAKSLGGRIINIRAEHFIFAAGTIETTRLLLFLDRLSNHHAFRGCRVLGSYFQDHLKAKVATIDRRHAQFSNRIFAYRFVRSTRHDLHLELSEEAQRRDGVASAFAYLAMNLSSSPLAEIRQVLRKIQRREPAYGELLQLSRNAGLLARSAYWRYVRNQVYAPASIEFDLMVCVEQLPNAENRIVLGEGKDAFGVPKARIEWSPKEIDEKTFRATIAHLGNFWRQNGFDQLCPMRLTPEAQDPSRAIIDKAEACAHPSGTTRLGSDPAMSVVDTDLRCHRMKNVSVASASTFPTAGSANPTLTIMKLALWLADARIGECGTSAAALRNAPAHSTTMATFAHA